MGVSNLQEDLGAYLNNVFDVYSGSGGIKRVNKDYWLFEWSSENFGSMLIDASDLFVICSIMRALTEAVLNQEFNQLRVLEESRQERVSYDPSTSQGVAPKRIAATSNISYKVSSTGEVGFLLVNMRPEGLPMGIIQDIENKPWDNLIEIVRSMLFCFHLKHGGFQRLATCEVCGKLIFKKRLRAEPTCSQECRSKKSYTEDVDKARCRHRQLGYLNNAVTRVDGIRPYGVIKEDCKLCPVVDVAKIRFGECPVVQERNKELIVKFERDKGKWWRRGT